MNLFNSDGVHQTISIEIAETFSLKLPDKPVHESVFIKKCLKINEVLIFMDNRDEISSYTFSKDTKSFETRNFCIQLADETLDMAVIGRNQIAVLLRNHIKCIDIGYYQPGIKKEIKFDIQEHTQYALSFSRNLFYVAQNNRNRVVITEFNCNGFSNDRIDVCRLRGNIEVQLTVRGNIYCSLFDPTGDEMERSIVYCFDGRNKTILWQFSDSCLGRLYGCTTDYFRNVYVTNGHYLTVISSTGRNYKILLNDVPPSSDVFFDDSERYLIVCAENGIIQLLRLEIVTL